jgi:hypothetical protein
MRLVPSPRLLLLAVVELRDLTACRSVKCRVARARALQLYSRATHHKYQMEYAVVVGSGNYS